MNTYQQPENIFDQTKRQEEFQRKYDAFKKAVIKHSEKDRRLRDRFDKLKENDFFPAEDFDSLFCDYMA